MEVSLCVSRLVVSRFGSLTRTFGMGEKPAGPNCSPPPGEVQLGSPGLVLVAAAPESGWKISSLTKAALPAETELAVSAGSARAGGGDTETLIARASETRTVRHRGTFIGQHSH